MANSIDDLNTLYSGTLADLMKTSDVSSYFIRLAYINLGVFLEELSNEKYGKATKTLISAVDILTNMSEDTTGLSDMLSFVTKCVNTYTVQVCSDDNTFLDNTANVDAVVERSVNLAASLYINSTSEAFDFTEVTFTDASDLNTQISAVSTDSFADSATTVFDYLVSFVSGIASASTPSNSNYTTDFGYLKSAVSALSDIGPATSGFADVLGYTRACLKLFESIALNISGLNIPNSKKLASIPQTYTTYLIGLNVGSVVASNDAACDIEDSYSYCTTSAVTSGMLFNSIQKGIYSTYYNSLDFPGDAVDYGALYIYSNLIMSLNLSNAGEYDAASDYLIGVFSYITTLGQRPACFTDVQNMIYAAYAALLVNDISNYDALLTSFNSYATVVATTSPATETTGIASSFPTSIADSALTIMSELKTSINTDDLNIQTIFSDLMEALSYTTSSDYSSAITSLSSAVSALADEIYFVEDGNVLSSAQSVFEYFVSTVIAAGALLSGTKTSTTGVSTSDVTSVAEVLYGLFTDSSSSISLVAYPEDIYTSLHSEYLTARVSTSIDRDAKMVFGYLDRASSYLRLNIQNALPTLVNALQSIDNNDLSSDSDITGNWTTIQNLAQTEVDLLPIYWMGDYESAQASGVAVAFNDLNETIAGDSSADLTIDSSTLESELLDIVSAEIADLQETFTDSTTNVYQVLTYLADAISDLEEAAAEYGTDDFLYAVSAAIDIGVDDPGFDEVYSVIGYVYTEIYDTILALPNYADYILELAGAYNAYMFYLNNYMYLAYDELSDTFEFDGTVNTWNTAAQSAFDSTGLPDASVLGIITSGISVLNSGELTEAQMYFESAVGMMSIDDDSEAITLFGTYLFMEILSQFVMGTTITGVSSLFTDYHTFVGLLSALNDFNTSDDSVTASDVDSEIDALSASIESASSNRRSLYESSCVSQDATPDDDKVQESIQSNINESKSSLNLGNQGKALGTIGVGIVGAKSSFSWSKFFFADAVSGVASLAALVGETLGAIWYESQQLDQDLANIPTTKNLVQKSAGLINATQEAATEATETCEASSDSMTVKEQVLANYQSIYTNTTTTYDIHSAYDSIIFALDAIDAMADATDTSALYSRAADSLNGAMITLGGLSSNTSGMLQAVKDADSTFNRLLDAASIYEVDSDEALLFGYSYILNQIDISAAVDSNLSSVADLVNDELTDLSSDLTSASSDTDTDSDLSPMDAIIKVLKDFGAKMALEEYSNAGSDLIEAMSWVKSLDSSDYDTAYEFINRAYIFYAGVIGSLSSDDPSSEYGLVISGYQNILETLISSEALSTDDIYTQTSMTIDTLSESFRVSLLTYSEGLSFEYLGSDAILTAIYTDLYFGALDLANTNYTNVMDFLSSAMTLAYDFSESSDEVQQVRSDIGMLLSLMTTYYVAASDFSSDTYSTLYNTYATYSSDAAALVEASDTNEIGYSSVLATMSLAYPNAMTMPAETTYTGALSTTDTTSAAYSAITNITSAISSLGLLEYETAFNYFNLALYYAGKALTSSNDFVVDMQYIHPAFVVFGQTLAAASDVSDDFDFDSAFNQLTANVYSMLTKQFTFSSYDEVATGADLSISLSTYAPYFQTSTSTHYSVLLANDALTKVSDLLVAASYISDTTTQETYYTRAVNYMMSAHASLVGQEVNSYGLIETMYMTFTATASLIETLSGLSTDQSTNIALLQQSISRYLVEMAETAGVVGMSYYYANDGISDFSDELVNFLSDTSYYSDTFVLILETLYNFVYSLNNSSYTDAVDNFQTALNLTEGMLQSESFYEYYYAMSFVIRAFMGLQMNYSSLDTDVVTGVIKSFNLFMTNLIYGAANSDIDSTPVFAITAYDLEDSFRSTLGLFNSYVLNDGSLAKDMLSSEVYLNLYYAARMLSSEDYTSAIAYVSYAISTASLYATYSIAMQQAIMDIPQIIALLDNTIAGLDDPSTYDLDMAAMHSSYDTLLQLVLVLDDEADDSTSTSTTTTTIDLSSFPAMNVYDASTLLTVVGNALSSVTDTTVTSALTDVQSALTSASADTPDYATAITNLTTAATSVSNLTYDSDNFWLVVDFIKASFETISTLASTSDSVSTLEDSYTTLYEDFYSIILDYSTCTAYNVSSLVDFMYGVQNVFDGLYWDDADATTITSDMLSELTTNAPTVISTLQSSSVVTQSAVTVLDSIITEFETLLGSVSITDPAAYATYYLFLSAANLVCQFYDSAADNFATAASSAAAITDTDNASAVDALITSLETELSSELSSLSTDDTTNSDIVSDAYDFYQNADTYSANETIDSSITIPTASDIATAVSSLDTTLTSNSSTVYAMYRFYTNALTVSSLLTSYEAETDTSTKEQYLDRAVEFYATALNSLYDLTGVPYGLSEAISICQSIYTYLISVYYNQTLVNSFDVRSLRMTFVQAQINLAGALGVTTLTTSDFVSDSIDTLITDLTSATSSTVVDNLTTFATDMVAADYTSALSDLSSAISALDSTSSTFSADLVLVLRAYNLFIGYPSTTGITSDISLVQSFSTFLEGSVGTSGTNDLPVYECSADLSADECTQLNDELSGGLDVLTNSMEFGLYGYGQNYLDTYSLQYSLMFEVYLNGVLAALTLQSQYSDAINYITEAINIANQFPAYSAEASEAIDVIGQLIDQLRVAIGDGSFTDSDSSLSTLTSAFAAMQSTLFALADETDDTFSETDGVLGSYPTVTIVDASTLTSNITSIEASITSTDTDYDTAISVLNDMATADAESVDGNFATDLDAAIVEATSMTYGTLAFWKVVVAATQATHYLIQTLYNNGNTDSTSSYNDTINTLFTDFVDFATESEAISESISYFEDEIASGEIAEEADASELASLRDTIASNYEALYDNASVIFDVRRVYDYLLFSLDSLTNISGADSDVQEYFYEQASQSFQAGLVQAMGISANTEALSSTMDDILSVYEMLLTYESTFVGDSDALSALEIAYMTYQVTMMAISNSSLDTPSLFAGDSLEGFEEDLADAASDDNSTAYTALLANLTDADTKLTSSKFSEGDTDINSAINWYSSVTSDEQTDALNFINRAYLLLIESMDSASFGSVNTAIHTYQDFLMEQIGATALSTDDVYTQTYMSEDLYSEMTRINLSSYSEALLASYAGSDALMTAIFTSLYLGSLELMNEDYTAALSYVNDAITKSGQFEEFSSNTWAALGAIGQYVALFATYYIPSTGYSSSTLDALYSSFTTLSTTLAALPEVDTDAEEVTYLSVLEANALVYGDSPLTLTFDTSSAQSALSTTTTTDPTYSAITYGGEAYTNATSALYGEAITSFNTALYQAGLADKTSTDYEIVMEYLKGVYVVIGSYLMSSEDYSDFEWEFDQMTSNLYGLITLPYTFTDYSTTQTADQALAGVQNLADYLQSTDQSMFSVMMTNDNLASALMLVDSGDYATETTDQQTYYERASFYLLNAIASIPTDYRSYGYSDALGQIFDTTAVVLNALDSLTTDESSYISSVQSAYAQLLVSLSNVVSIEGIDYYWANDGINTFTTDINDMLDSDVDYSDTLILVLKTLLEFVTNLEAGSTTAIDNFQTALAFAENTDPDTSFSTYYFSMVFIYRAFIGLIYNFSNFDYSTILGLFRGFANFSDKFIQAVGICICEDEGFMDSDSMFDYTKSMQNLYNERVETYGGLAIDLSAQEMYMNLEFASKAYQNGEYSTGITYATYAVDIATTLASYTTTGIQMMTDIGKYLYSMAHSVFSLEDSIDYQFDLLYLGLIYNNLKNEFLVLADDTSSDPTVVTTLSIDPANFPAVTTFDFSTLTDAISDALADEANSDTNVQTILGQINSSLSSATDADYATAITRLTDAVYNTTNDIEYGSSTYWTLASYLKAVFEAISVAAGALDDTSSLTEDYTTLYTDLATMMLNFDSCPGTILADLSDWIIDTDIAYGDIYNDDIDVSTVTSDIVTQISSLTTILSALDSSDIVNTDALSTLETIATALSTKLGSVSITDTTAYVMYELMMSAANIVGVFYDDATDNFNNGSAASIYITDTTDQTTIDGYITSLYNELTAVLDEDSTNLEIVEDAKEFYDDRVTYLADNALDSSITVDTIAQIGTNISDLYTTLGSDASTVYAMYRLIDHMSSTQDLLALYDSSSDKTQFDRALDFYGLALIDLSDLTTNVFQLDTAIGILESLYIYFMNEYYSGTFYDYGSIEELRAQYVSYQVGLTSTLGMDLPSYTDLISDSLDTLSTDLSGSSSTVASDLTTFVSDMQALDYESARGDLTSAISDMSSSSDVATDLGFLMRAYSLYRGYLSTLAISDDIELLQSFNTYILSLISSITATNTLPAITCGEDVDADTCTEINNEVIMTLDTMESNIASSLYVYGYNYDVDYTPEDAIVFQVYQNAMFAAINLGSLTDFAVSYITNAMNVAQEFTAYSVNTEVAIEIIGQLVTQVMIDYVEGSYTDVTTLTSLLEAYQTMRDTLFALSEQDEDTDTSTSGVLVSMPTLDVMALSDITSMITKFESNMDSSDSEYSDAQTALSSLATVVTDLGASDVDYAAQISSLDSLITAAEAVTYGTENFWKVAIAVSSVVDYVVQALISNGENTDSSTYLTTVNTMFSDYISFITDASAMSGSVYFDTDDTITYITCSSDTTCSSLLTQLQNASTSSATSLASLLSSVQSYFATNYLDQDSIDSFAQTTISVFGIDGSLYGDGTISQDTMVSVLIEAILGAYADLHTDSDMEVGKVSVIDLSPTNFTSLVGEVETIYSNVVGSSLDGISTDTSIAASLSDIATYWSTIYSAMVDNSVSSANIEAITTQFLGFFKIYKDINFNNVMTLYQDSTNFEDSKSPLLSLIQEGSTSAAESVSELMGKYMTAYASSDDSYSGKEVYGAMNEVYDIMVADSSMQDYAQYLKTEFDNYFSESYAKTGTTAAGVYFPDAYDTDVTSNFSIDSLGTVSIPQFILTATIQAVLLEDVFASNFSDGSLTITDVVASVSDDITTIESASSVSFSSLTALTTTMKAQLTSEQDLFEQLMNQTFFALYYGAAGSTVRDEIPYSDVTDWVDTFTTGLTATDDSTSYTYSYTDTEAGYVSSIFKDMLSLNDQSTNGVMGLNFVQIGCEVLEYINDAISSSDIDLIGTTFASFLTDAIRSLEEASTTSTEDTPGDDTDEDDEQDDSWWIGLITGLLVVGGIGGGLYGLAVAASEGSLGWLGETALQALAEFAGEIGQTAMEAAFESAADAVTATVEEGISLMAESAGEVLEEGIRLPVQAGVQTAMEEIAENCVEYTFQFKIF